MSRRALPWIAPLALTPVLALGWWMWRDQATSLWLAGFFAACL
jgi:hypothetical protein